MKTIISTFNFYPFAAGGTEVYVTELAHYLQQQGHEVIIFASHPGADHPLYAGEEIYRKGRIKAFQYTWNSYTIVGINLEHKTLAEQYSKESADLFDAYVSILDRVGFVKPDNLLINGFSLITGISLIDALLSSQKNVRIMTFFHTAITCSKGDLLIESNRMCDITPEPVACAGCVLGHKLNLPVKLGQWFIKTADILHFSRLGEQHIIFNLKALIGMHLSSLERLTSVSHRIVVFSEMMKKSLVDLGIEPDKIFCHRHAIAALFFNGDTRKTKNPVSFVYAGRWEKIKGIYTLLKGWLRTEDKRESKQLIIASKSPEIIPEKLGRLLSKIIARKDVVMAGALTQEELGVLYRKSHYVIIPSECVETGPLVFHEAVASGCRVICSDIGGCQELAAVYNDVSELFEVGNDEALALKINAATDDWRPVTKSHTISTWNAHFDYVTSDFFGHTLSA